ncbi:MAG: radical SAM protein, partial [Phycisphaerae bacterium]
MTVVAAIQADLDTTPLGTRSRLADGWDGTSWLRRTVDRVARVRNLRGVFVLCPGDQHDRCAALLDGTGALVRSHEPYVAPWRSLVQAARKWSLDGWRGGIGGTTSFDEYCDCPAVSGLLNAVGADAVLSIPPAAPFFDPELADRMIGHLAADDEVRMVFTQAPPGLSGLVMDADLVHELADKGIPVGWVLNYKPDAPQKDLIFQSCCYDIPAVLRHTTRRLIADTDRAVERIRDLAAHATDPDLATVGAWLTRRDETHVPPLPHEVEIEPTTDDAYPDALLRPRGPRLERTGMIDPAVVEAVADELRRYDDSLMVLGGFGDPLRHPQFRDIVHAARCPGRGVYGLAVRTTGVDLADDAVNAMIDARVDVLNVILDAWTPQRYAALQTPRAVDEASRVRLADHTGADRRADGSPPADHDARADLDAVLRRLDRLNELRQAKRTATPLTLPEMTKAVDNVDELDDFFDGWIRRAGAVHVSGHSRFAGQLDDRSVINMAPPNRTPCRRIRARCMILADGRLTVCDQDFRGVEDLRQFGVREFRRPFEMPRRFDDDF